EKSYLTWIRRFLEFHGGRPAETLGENEIVRFLSNLSTEHRVSMDTISYALSGHHLLCTPRL
ncbi:MAG: phage integrase N-terminal SAM-like domain-containing protein, partial [Planctomycetota bacterium]